MRSWRGVARARGRVGRGRAGAAAARVADVRADRAGLGAVARRAAAAGVAAHRPRAIIYSSTTAALLGPAPGAIRFDAPAAGNRPGRHGVWQRPVERGGSCRRRCSCRGARAALAEAPWPRADGGRRAGAGGAERPAGGDARHRRGDLRREPAEEGPRPGAGGVARGAPRGRGAGGGRRRRRRRRRGRALARACCRARSTGRCCAARACSSRRRGARTTGSPSSRRWRTDARSSRRRRPGPYAALPLARALDPRLVGDSRLIRRARRAAPGYATAPRRARAVAAGAVDRVVAEARDPVLAATAALERAGRADSATLAIDRRGGCTAQLARPSECACASEAADRLTALGRAEPGRTRRYPRACAAPGTPPTTACWRLPRRQPRPPRRRDPEPHATRGSPPSGRRSRSGSSRPASAAARAWTSLRSRRSGAALISSIVPVRAAASISRDTSSA